MRAPILSSVVSPAAGPHLSTGRRLLFTALMISLPVLLFLILEMVLRWTEYGGDLDLVNRTTVGGREMHVINRNVARRYFAGSVSAPPEPNDDLFPVMKARNTRRIFCLGESTMQGFPFEYHATPPAFLRDRLTATLPGYSFEVINLGLSAVGSVVVEDFVSELVRYDPDLLIVYLGHNEFYGVYGVGSSVGTAGSGWLSRLAVSLLRFKTYLLLRDGYLSVRRLLGPEPTTSPANLMGHMVGNQSIPYGGPLYRKARGIYEDNLRSIIRLARGHGVPIMFSTLVSNLKDQSPFVSVFDEHTGTEGEDLWRMSMRRGDSLRAAGDHAGAAVAYGAAVRQDTMNASGFYALGQALYGARRFPEAKVAFERARDRDALRFRASSDFQHLLLQVCRSEGVPAARVDSAFEAVSPNGVVGKNLILEHLHPNIHGYFLMAKVWTDALRRENVLVPAGDWLQARNPSDEELMRESTVSAFDSSVGRIKVELLIHRWPFAQSLAAPSFSPGNTLEALVYRYVQGRIPWSEARYVLADEYASQKKFEQARNECRAVAKVIPFSYQPLLRIANLYRQEGDDRQAKETYRRCAEVEDNPFSRMKLAIILLEEQNPREASLEIERAMALVGGGKHKMTPAATATALYLLGAAYAQLGRYRDARQTLQRALAIQSDLAEARELLNRLAKVP